MKKKKRRKNTINPFRALTSRYEDIYIYGIYIYIYIYIECIKHT